jgi:dephospho-CoA kinase
MIIGISGGSGAGKSTTSRILSNIIPDSQLIVVDVLMHKYSFQYEDVILSKMNVNTDHKIHCYNYFHDSFEKIKIWIDTIKDYVVTDINKIIEENPNKNYIIDWCYLPLCDLYKKCNYTICVKSNFEDRKKL